MYLSAYARMYADLCRALRRHSRLRLNSSLCRDPYCEPYPTLNRASFQKPFEKPNPALFHRLYDFKYRSSYGLGEFRGHSKRLLTAENSGDTRIQNSGDTVRDY